MLLDVIFGGFTVTNLVISILASLIVIFLTLPVHEFAHGFAANKLGDPTARYQGRLTLNPFAHIDYLGALCILLVGFGWAKPVPINSYYFKKPKRDIAITALAGPVSNLLMALLAVVIRNIIILIFSPAYFQTSYILYDPTQLNIWFYIINILQYVAIINISLAVFNLIPVPPLDGSRLLSAFLPDKYYYKLMRYEQYLIWIVFILLVSNVLDAPMAAANNFFYGCIDYIATLPFKLF